MGGGDLNLKKSWHPATMRNQEKVWKEEQKAAEEAKKLEVLRRELQKEREYEELQRLQEKGGGKKRVERLDWMYSIAGSSSNVGINLVDKEDYLLGSKKVDKLIHDSTVQSVDPLFLNSNKNANSLRDTQAKIREDPLFLMKKREKQSLDTMLQNPLLKTKDKKKKKKRQQSRSNSRSRSPTPRKRKLENGNHTRHLSPHRRSPRTSFKERNEQDRPRIRSSEHNHDRRSHRHSSPGYEHKRNSSRSRGTSHRSRSPSSRRRLSPRQKEDTHKQDKEREQKLREMMENAKTMDAEREKRYEEDKKQRKIDEQLARERIKELEANEASFMINAHKQAYRKL